jgi:hypothetical protein
MTNIMQKLGVRNRLEAVLMGQKRQRASAPFPSMEATASVAPERSVLPMKSTTPQ